MAEYIEREKVKQGLNDELNSLGATANCHYREGLQFACELIEKEQTADVAEVVHGYWKPDYEYEDLGICSVCNSTGGKYENYCSSCGARMDGAER